MAAARPTTVIIGADVAAAVVLLVVGIASRGGALPIDGLYRDDAWVVASAVHGSFSELVWVGWAHPGFTAVLMGWASLVGGDAVRFAYPVFLAGVLAPALLYLALRWFGYARSIAAVLAAALLAADAHVVYSGRVKPYVIDTVVVLGLAVVLPRLARTTWGWSLACGWVLAALMLSSISGFALIATVAAGAVVVASSSNDRVVRVSAVGMQAVASLGWLLAARSSYNGDLLEEFWAERHDAFPDFTFNPVRLGAELVEHAQRVTEVFPGGPGWLALLLVGAAAAGLVGASLAGGNRVRVRYLLLVLSAAVVAGFARVLPFGPLSRDLAPGGRVTLWLIPTVAVGLAAALQFLRSRAASRSRPLQVGLDGTLYVLAAVLALSALVGTPPSYPSRGSAAATNLIESELGSRDVVLFFPSSRYEYAAASELDIELHRDRETMNGFVPAPSDARVHVLTTGTAAEIEQVVGEADRVFLYAAYLAFSDFESVKKALDARGFEEEVSVAYGGYEDAALWIWQR